MRNPFRSREGRSPVPEESELESLRREEQGILGIRGMERHADDAAKLARIQERIKELEGQEMDKAA